MRNASTTTASSFTSPRALTVQSPALPQVAAVVALVPLKLEGVESINALFEYTLTLQTPDALMFNWRCAVCVCS